MKKWLKWILFLSVIGMGVFWFGVGAVIKNGQKPLANGSAKYAIVLGAKVKKGGVPSQSLKFRLDAALQYATQYPDVLLIVSGGQGEDEDMTEASFMKKYLVDRGISASRVIEEDQSRTTFENIEFSMAKMKTPQKKVTIISSDFHLARAKMIAHHFHMDADVVAAKTPNSVAWKLNMRERFGILNEWIKMR